jgi:hypothetical protein
MSVFPTRVGVDLNAINEVLEPHGDLTLEAVRRWRNGLNLPDYWMMLYIFDNTNNSDWRNLFAGDVMAILRPDLWDKTKGEQNERIQ